MQFSDIWSPTTELKLDDYDLTKLEIRPASGRAIYYFYDTVQGRLITDFILEDRDRVMLLCQVTIVKKDDEYSPRLRFWKKDKSKASKVAVETEVPCTKVTHQIKASVDTEGGNGNLWKLIQYIQAVMNTEPLDGALRVVKSTDSIIAELVDTQGREQLLSSLRQALGGSLTTEDISMLADRKADVERFERLLTDQTYFAAECERLDKRGEALWQDFFEKSNWIFGYGLVLVGHEAIDDGRLERITTGASLFSGGGKRVDAIMKSRAVISTLLFCEIKRHDSKLLETEPYRRPDVYRASKDLVGGTAQLQKTVRKSVRSFIDQVDNLTADDGSPTGIAFSTTRPRQVLVIGDLAEFKTAHGPNGEMVETFELYRRGLADVEVITFDELLARARFILQN